jgi:5-methylcytosine-specific restriction endonuclease McrA
MAMTPRYQEYLKSDKWKAKRLRVLQRDNFICQKCGDRAWQVHHKTYERIFNEHPSDLVSLCGDCHKDIHKIKKSKKISVFGGIGKVWARVIG